jgi:hypothetical protein
MKPINPNFFMILNNPFKTYKAQAAEESAVISINPGLILSEGQADWEG